MTLLATLLLPSAWVAALILVPWTRWVTVLLLGAFLLHHCQ